MKSEERSRIKGTGYSEERFTRLSPKNNDSWDVISDIRREMNMKALRREHYLESLSVILWTSFFLISASYLGFTESISSAVQSALFN